MKDSDRRRFASIVQGYQVELHQRPALSQEALTIWWEMLVRYDLTEIESALAKYHMTPGSGQFPPKPSDVIGIIEGYDSDLAIIQWHRVASAVPRLGRYSEPDFGDSLTHAAITALGGWGRLCAMTTDQMSQAGRDFQKIYIAFKHGRRLALPPISNRPAGLPIQAHEAFSLLTTEGTDHA